MKELLEIAQEKGYKLQVCISFTGTRLFEMELFLIQKWLREEHKLHIYIDTTATFDKSQPSKWRASVKVPFQPFRWTTGFYYLEDTYEEALIKGIEQALKLIK